MISQLVINGCSYAHAYVQGGGHHDLAARLKITAANSLAESGCANTRILRSTLKHSFAATEPTLYVLGMTFLSRNELPILAYSPEREDRWTNPQNQDHAHLWQPGWTAKQTKIYVELMLQWESESILDRLEDLQYRMISAIESLRSRGHRAVIFNQADDISWVCDDHRLGLLRARAEFVDGYRWQAIQWQHQQGVPAMDYGNQPRHVVPEEMKHRKPGCHKILNQFLTDYIRQHGLIA